MSLGCSCKEDVLDVNRPVGHCGFSPAVCGRDDAEEELGQAGRTSEQHTLSRVLDHTLPEVLILHTLLFTRFYFATLGLLVLSLEIQVRP